MDNKALLQPQPQQVVVHGVAPVVQATPIALDGSLLNCECSCLHIQCTRRRRRGARTRSPSAATASKQPIGVLLGSKRVGAFE